ncbi:MAG: type II secretion system F family protein [Bryobacteraceae bacterium]|jgi:tight adherence protein B
MTAVFLVFIFVCCFAALGAALLIVSQMRAQQRMRQEDPDAADTDLFRDDALSTISAWASILKRFDFADLLRRRLEEAGLSWSPGRLTLLMLLCGAVSMAVLARFSWVPLWATLLAGAAITAFPYTMVLRLRARRFLRFQENFPDALDSLARAMRAGHPLAAAMDLVANEAEEPAAGEMRRTVAEVSLGVSWDRALAHLTERMPVPDVALFAAAVQLQVRSGGKLGDALAKLSEDMRETVALRGEVNAVAAHGKLTGAILTAMPFAIALMMMVVNPQYMATLFHYQWGKDLIWAALTFLVLGHLVIRRIVTVKT